MSTRGSSVDQGPIKSPASVRRTFVRLLSLLSLLLASPLDLSLPIFLFRRAAAAQSTPASTLPTPWPESTPPLRTSKPDPLVSPAVVGAAVGGGAVGDAAVVGAAAAAAAAAAVVGAPAGPAAIDAAATEILLIASVVLRSMGHETI